MIACYIGSVDIACSSEERFFSYAERNNPMEDYAVDIEEAVECREILQGAYIF